MLAFVKGGQTPSLALNIQLGDLSYQCPCLEHSPEKIQQSVHYNYLPMQEFTTFVE